MAGTRVRAPSAIANDTRVILVAVAASRPRPRTHNTRPLVMLTVRVPASTVERLNEVAAARGSGRSDVIRELLDQLDAEAS